jgi:hypothetical protein
MKQLEIKGMLADKKIPDRYKLGRRLGSRLFYNEYRLANKSVSMFRSTLIMLNSKNYYSKQREANEKV